MGSLIHIAEIAAILAAAYMVGWTIGYLAHRLASPRTVTAVAIPGDRLAAAVGAPAAEALVKAPIIDPVAIPTDSAKAATATPASPDSVVPSEVIAGTPAPASSASAAAELRNDVPQPAPSDLPIVDAPAAATALPANPEPAIAVAAPIDAPPPTPGAPETPPVPETPEVPAASIAVPTSGPGVRALRRFRSAASKIAAQTAPIADPLPTNFSAMPANRPGVPWTGEIRGKPADAISGPVGTIPPVDSPEPPAAEITTPPTPASEPVPAALEPEPVVETPASVEPVGSPPVYDEDAAMRAIEGGWSRVKARALPEAPELSDLGAAVAAATTAVEQVLARAGIDIDTEIQEERPKGLGRPRNGIKDDLKRINGLGALDESTLNNMGVYHYEQVARWNAAQVAWMENHVFARGRIGREDWQAQARALIPPPSF